MARVLYLLAHYPQISETYMDTEMRVLAERHEIHVVTFHTPHLAPREHRPFRRVGSNAELDEAVRAIRPDVVHAHYLPMAPAALHAARVADALFTLRAHSFDVFGAEPADLAALAPAARDPRCRAVLTFPPTVARLAAAGFDRERLVAAPPLVDFARFHDRAPNGDGVMNVGAALPKKAFDDYVRLAARLPEQTFDLYPMGALPAAVERLNAELGHPVRVQPPIEPSAMPREYKRHRWLVYTACPRLRTVGWPMAVAEAQAAGVGVCLRRIRPDLADYLGGAGFLFDTLDEVARIVAGPVPDEVRERGFEWARRSDARAHVALLEERWTAS